MHPTVQKTALFTLFLLGVLVMIMDAPSIPAPQPRLSPQREAHILYGDDRGGGHLHGVGQPCKSEFPAAWTARDVIKNVREAAANDNINWRREQNGYYSGEGTIHRVRVRIILDGEKDDIITAYPINLPRNPCPVKQSP